VHPLRLDTPSGRPPRLLCLGAHADDLEIGCGGTVLHLIRTYPGIHCRWVVWSGDETRTAEARDSATKILAGAGRADVSVERFRNGYFPDQWALIKQNFDALKAEGRPDLILTHHRRDRHQDHRLLAELTWNTWRDDLILEYEIPKYEGDLSTPNLYVPLDRATVDHKVEILMTGFASQRTKPWYDAETFRGLMRIRGVECAAPGGYAEGFHAPKLTLT
jgi:LmbE family N-acetylglucosaminyl deacetylase